MSRPDKKKIATDAGTNIGGGFFQAFAGLNAEGLPSGPPETNEKDAPASKQKAGRVVLRKETAHRGGKIVIVVDGFEPHHSEEGIAALGKKLRAACGCGGAAKGRTLELQGDLAGRIREFLEREGFKVAGVK